jgi:hypothetical protein
MTKLITQRRNFISLFCNDTYIRHPWFSIETTICLKWHLKIPFQPDVLYWYVLHFYMNWSLYSIRRKVQMICAQQVGLTAILSLLACGMMTDRSNLASTVKMRAFPVYYAVVIHWTLAVTSCTYGGRVKCLNSNSSNPSKLTDSLVELHRNPDWLTKMELSPLYWYARDPQLYFIYALSLMRTISA